MTRFFGLTSALISVCGLALSSCGGGGEDTGFALSAPDINGSSAIIATGGSPPDVSSAQARTQLMEILVGASVRYSMRVSVEADGDVDRWGPVTHTGSSCTSSDCVSADIEPIMVKNGVRLAMESSIDFTYDDGAELWIEEREYYGWMDHSTFSIYGAVDDTGDVWGRGNAYGEPSRTNPSFSPFSWSGVMVGRNSDLKSSRVGNVIQGDAAISVELSQTGDMSADVAFSNIRDLNTGGSIADIAWADLPVVDGSFETSTILGSFFGPQHEEVAGAFEKDHVLGAFGARR